MKIIKILLITVLVLVIVVPLIIRGVNKIKDNDNPEPKKDNTESSSKGSSTSTKDVLPDTIRELYHLSNGSKIRVYTHEGYDYTRSSGGWKYYCQPQNGPRVIRGDGTSYDDGKDIAYFDLEFYEVECDILVTYIKIKK